ncbi:MAG: hypothetical protein IPO02_03685 [Bacteroidetes bacterium]|nr:hypothetical protein [Bacteroidota bacterium]
MKNKFMLLLIIIISNMTIQAQNPYANYNHWITDNWVYAVASDGVNTYVGGSFSAVGPPTGAGTKITATNTNPDLSQCRPNSQVTVSIPDGLGGLVYRRQFYDYRCRLCDYSYPQLFGTYITEWQIRSCMESEPK